MHQNFIAFIFKSHTIHRLSILISTFIYNHHDNITLFWFIWHFRNLVYLKALYSQFKNVSMKKKKKMILKENNTKENNIIYTEVQIFFNLKFLFTKILISNLTMDWSWCRTGTLWFFFTEKLRQVSIFCYYACQYLFIIYCIETLIFMNRTTFF